MAYSSFKWPNQGDDCFRALNTRGPTRLGCPLHYPQAENRPRTFRYTENYVLVIFQGDFPKSIKTSLSEKTQAMVNLR